MRWMRLSAVGLGLVLVTAGCVNDSGEGGAAGGGDFPSRTLRIMAPASPGGGWDQTSRAAQQALEQGVVDTGVEVFNVPQAGGTVGLAQLVNEKGNGHLLMTMGLVMVGAIQTNKSQVTLDQTTPIARLTAEAEAIVVPAKSSYQTLDDLVAALKANPGKVSIAGGSAGGTDQILAGLLAQATDVDPRKINYIAYSGGGESLAALLGGKVAAGISGVGEYSEQVLAGDLKGLAVSSEQRSTQVPDVPTMTEAGTGVVLSNWRGLMTHPGMAADAFADLVDLVTRAHDTPEWKDVLSKNGWDDLFLPGEPYATFLTEEENRVRTILDEIGL
jgi:putative tricarboxylic transport membrane protein